MADLLKGEIVQCETSDRLKLHGMLITGGARRVWLVTHGVNGNFYGSSLLREIAGFLVQHGYGVLLANNRGHDLASLSYGAIPHRIGSQFETISNCVHDMDGWISFLHEQQFQPYGLVAHSLGAVKGAYWLSQRDSELQRFIALSPPRLNTDLLLNDAKRGKVFREQLAEANRLCGIGKGDEIVKVRFPLPTWVSAATFADKYGSGEKYDYLTRLEQIVVPTLWGFGSQEVEDGSNNFRLADLNIQELVHKHSLFQHQVLVIAGADHSYTDRRAELCHAIKHWLT